MSPVAQTVVHVVRSDSFAGVERYICDVAQVLAERQWRVVAIGGDSEEMARGLGPAVEHRPAASFGATVAALRGLGRVSLVHAHMTAAEMAAVASRPWTRAPVVATRHFAGRRGTHPGVRLAAAWLARGIAREIAISRFVADHVEGRPLVISNGVPSAPQAAYERGNRVVLLVQRLQPEKCTELALQIFAQAGIANQGWRLWIAGRGPLTNELQAEAERLSISEHVDFLGFVDDPGRLRNEADIFLATAPAEPFGLSLAEAMAAGLPIVASAGGAHAEVVGDTGLLFTPGDADEGAALLRRLCESSDLRTTLGARARERQQEVLSVERHVDQLEVLYRDVMVGASRRRGHDPLRDAPPS